MFPVTFLGFGFGNLAMLGWLAAVAAPLLIHLWSRHRFRETTWAAMQFLLAAMQKNARRLQVQQWLLLALRTLLIALVVLAVAEPYGERLSAGGHGAATHHILVLDGSYSMAYSDGGMSLFRRAKQAVATQIRDSRAADTFTVILMTRPAAIIAGRDHVDHAQVAGLVEALIQPHTDADLAGTLTLVHEAIDENDSRREPGRTQVTFYTDLQQATWGDESLIEAGKSGSLRDRFAVLSKRAGLTVVDLGQPRAANTAVTKVTNPDAFVTHGREATFDVTLRQFGSQPRAECVVELLIDGVPLGEQTVDVPAGGDRAVRFTHRFGLPGEHTVAIRAAGDHLAVDDARWLVVPVREEIRVLCVAGRPDAARYVADALNPNPAGNSPIRPVVVAEGELADVDLARFDCVFLCNVAQLTPSEANRLKRFSMRGGGIVFFLGDRVVAGSYNSLADGQQPLLPARLGEVVIRQRFGVDPLDYRHPIVEPFRGRPQAGLLTTPITRYFKLDVPSSHAGAKIAAKIDGQPLIVTAPVGAGRSVLVATDGSLASIDANTGEPWTYWPTWPSFLPIVRELLAYAVGGQQQRWQTIVGAPLSGRSAAGSVATSGAGTLKIERPDGQTAIVSVQSTPDGAQWNYAATDMSGIYSLRGLPESHRYFAVNVDTTESNLTKVDARQLPPELQIAPVTHSGTTEGGSGQTQVRWNQSLLWTALALLFVESFLAWRFGRGAA